MQTRYWYLKKLMNSSVFFDLDGTLVDSKSDLVRAVVYAARTLNLSVLKKDHILSLVGNGIHALIENYLREINKFDYYQRFLEIFLNYYYENICIESYLYDGVEDVLSQLAKKYSLFVVSNKLEKFSKKLLNELGILECFIEVVGGDSFQNKKPNPEPILQLVKKYDLNLDKSLFIGDSENDYMAAKSACVKMAWVSFGYRNGYILKKITPDFILDKFCYILSIVL